MAFGDLESMDLAGFVRRERAPEALWGLVHIPKTAGTALVDALMARRRPYFNIHPEAYEDNPDAHRASLDAAVERFLAAYANRPASGGAGLFSGHLERGQIDRICAAIPQVRLVTYLRDPVERAISHYRYCLTPEHPLHEAFARRFPGLMDFVAARSNIQARFIAGPGVASADQVIEFAMRRFAFIGTAETLESCNRVLAALLGVEAFETSRLNVTRAIPANDIAVTDKTREAIAEANRLDVALHRHVAGLLADRVVNAVGCLA
jgi:hypothetical protein